MKNMKKTILLIEDDADIRDALIETLEHEHFIVHTAKNGKDAFEVLAKGCTPDLILLDMMMPVMNGKEFRKAQLNHPEFAKIPVILISADFSVQKGLPELNIEAYVSKPFSIDVLIEKISERFKHTTELSA